MENIKIDEPTIDLQINRNVYFIRICNVTSTD